MLRKNPPPAPPAEPVEAICVEGFRPGVIAPEVERWTRLPINHELVEDYPEFFRGLVPLNKEATDGTSEPGQ